MLRLHIDFHLVSYASSFLLGLNFKASSQRNLRTVVAPLAIIFCYHAQDTEACPLVVGLFGGLPFSGTIIFLVNAVLRACVRAYVHTCALACVRACLCVWVPACARASERACVRACFKTS